MSARTTWEREMRILNTIARYLVAGLLALAVRMLLDGLTFAGGLAVALLVVLLLTCFGLRRRGRRLEPSEEPDVARESGGLGSS